MNSKQRNLLLVLILVIIVGIVFVIESRKANQGSEFSVVEVASPTKGMDLEMKEKMFEQAKEITTPDGFINTEPFSLADYIGEKVILIDFWTYSCINCQRTTPFLNAWWEKYEDDGLLMVGIHTPEFEFEKDYDNVAAAVEEFGIEFPIVLDNDYSTWRAYQNRYWPRKYLIDIDGFIVYDHIGEGAYEKTEKKIQELLSERRDRLGLDEVVNQDIVDIEPERALFVQTPEIYFGAARNNQIVNHVAYQEGLQLLSFPDDASGDHVYLDGAWSFTSEYVTTTEQGAKILLNYKAKNVFMVASADSDVRLRVTRNGDELGQEAGSSVEDGIVVVQADQLYKLIEDSSVGEHQLLIEVLDPGLRAFTFTFG